MRYACSVLLLCFSLSVQAGGVGSVAEAESLAESMIEKFVDKNFKAGLDLAKEHWPLPEVEIDNLLNQIEQQWPIVDQRYGQATGKEFLFNEKIGNSFLRYYFLHKFQNHAIYWKITFYKPTNKWLINEVQFLDDLDILYR